MVWWISSAVGILVSNVLVGSLTKEGIVSYIEPLLCKLENWLNKALKCSSTHFSIIFFIVIIWLPIFRNDIILIFVFYFCTNWKNFVFLSSNRFQFNLNFSFQKTSYKFKAISRLAWTPLSFSLSKSVRPCTSMSV